MFYLSRNYSINEGFYYLYRFKRIFDKFQYTWSVVVSTHKILGDDILEQFSSLSQRLEFICRSYDKISYFDLKKANNDTQSNTIYHFSYFIMLITGIFDDIAWILKHRYNLNLSNMEVGLKIPECRETNKFYNKLKSKNERICDYLINESTQNYIRLFYPLRDTLQHRRFLRGVRVKSSSDNIDKNLYLVPQKMIDYVNKLPLSLEELGISKRIGDSYYLDAHLFAYKSIYIVAEIVNSTLPLVDWNEIIELLDMESLKSIIESNKDYEKGLGTHLGWSSEPIYF
ncbi:hypothetical protein [Desulfuribacillus alkaliarsenatis]|uniref:Uncharacterized protein n=1 Tax=Desulfuribacillus alkaliarsenatis TaxID=766136 RepID=A0A1E5G0T9_9FIRM|nr:hypothetical protein [Desulfuribacillus alkaliarsenatis]OEF96363.1 hypothetical protein BHF68_09440 [Desulfuribacillus alkaliarsenatis]